MSQIFRILSEIVVDPGDLEIPKGDISSNTVATVLEIAFAALGSVAFLIIVVAGMKFTLSRGNPDAIGKARNTIIYAAVGLVVSMLAFSIVRFVVRNV